MIASYASIPSSSSTIEAEQGLGIGCRCSYWYISRVETLYGRVLMVWELQSDLLDASILPTDSGGIWHDHIEVDPPFLNPAEKGTFVDTNTLDAETGLDLFELWLAESYANTYEYVADLSPPISPALPRIIPTSPPNCGIAWSWEMRIDCTNFPSNGLRLANIFWCEEDFLVFRVFLRDTVPDPHYNSYVSLLATVSKVYGTLNEATQQARSYVASLT
jgi:hypothetical protein